MEKVTTKRLALYTGRTHPELAREVAAHLNIELGQDNLVTFSNGELRCRFGESVRGTDVFIMQSHYGVDGASVNENFAAAARNLDGVDILPSMGANVYDILKRDTLVLTKAGIEALEARLK